MEQLRVIVAVAKRSSFSEAARSLQLTQPAVTRTIRIAEGVGGVIASKQHSRSAGV
ncbi:helix-turn-helix domain-containing protein [Brevibacterium casei]|uniref:helix-turn-helix domain-containing protein n=1 Tax=Brevibacterium casei TaxID=33889 RepID=UPI0039F13339